MKFLPNGNDCFDSLHFLHLSRHSKFKKEHLLQTHYPDDELEFFLFFSLSRSRSLRSLSRSFSRPLSRYLSRYRYRDLSRLDDYFFLLEDALNVTLDIIFLSSGS